MLISSAAAMKAHLSQHNVIVLASFFNPSIFRESWFLKNGLLGEDELLPGYMFTPQVVSLLSKRFSVVLIPQQLQFSATEVAMAAETTLGVLGKMVKALPHTPFSGIGINFVWSIDVDGAPIGKVTRALFAKGDSLIANEFSDDSAHFGAYMSKDVEAARLKLDIKPVRSGPDLNGPVAVQCAFNFDRPLGDNAINDIEAVLSRWDLYRTLSETIVNRICGA
jgi:hypothetical protein